MGKIKIKTLGNEEDEIRQKEEARVKRDEKKKREASAKASAPKEASPEKENVQEKKEEPKQVSKKESKKHVRGKKYTKAFSLIENKKEYSLKEALSLLSKIKFASFDESVELHANLKEQVKGEVQLPHGTGKTINVVIATDAIIEQIEKGVMNFDVLLATPAMMPKLVKLAKILGPKGLMPNPKNGTVTPNPEEAMKKFAGGAVRYKSEPKFPILHQVVGKSSFAEKDLTENVNAIIKSIGREKITSVYLNTTMSPSVKLDIGKA